MDGYVGLPPAFMHEVKVSTYHFPSSLSSQLSGPLCLRTDALDFLAVLHQILGLLMFT